MLKKLQCLLGFHQHTPFSKAVVMSTDLERITTVWACVRCGHTYTETEEYRYGDYEGTTKVPTDPATRQHIRNQMSLGYWPPKKV